MYNRLIIFALALLLILAVPQGFATTSLPVSPRFNSLWVDQGLPNNAVLSITQDSQGYIWLGTFNGLSRYDGYHIKNFHADNRVGTLADDDIRVLLTDSLGTLWIGTHAGGLNRYHAKQETFDAFQHNDNNPYSLSSNSILALLDNGDGTLWVGTDKGLDLFNYTTGESQHFAHNPQNKDHSLPAKAVRTLLKTTSGQLWVGTGAGLAVSNNHGVDFHQIELPGIASPSLRSLLEDNRGNIWIATLQGLFKYDPITTQITSLKKYIKAPHRMLSLVQAPDGRVWAGSSHHGLYQFTTKPIDTTNDTTNDTAKPTANPLLHQYRYDKSNQYSLADNTLISLYIDQSGMLWAGTFNGGASAIALNSLAFGRFNDSVDSLGCLPGPAISALLPQDDATLWIGTQSGLAKVNHKNGHCVVFTPQPGNPRSIPNPEIKSIYRDSQQQLWIGTAKGLVKYQQTTADFDKPDDKLANTVITFVTQDNKNRLVAGTNQGLFIKNHQTGHFQAAANHSNNSPLNTAKMDTYTIDPHGRLWLGSEHGLAWLNTDNNTLDFLRLNNQPLFTMPVRALYVDHHNSLWIGSERAGLFRLDLKTLKIQRINTPVGFPQTTEFHAILPDDNGNLWISSSHGLLRYNPRYNAARVFHASDGLQSEVFFIRSAFKTPNGVLYFGGRKGFNRFNPDDIFINRQPPPVVLNGVFHFNKPATQASDTLTLTHRDYVFGFEFSALDFADPTRNRFAYKMQGFDPFWNYTGADNRRVSYTNLDPGSYTFRVKAANKDGVWNEQGVSVAVTIKPAPWASPLAYSVYLLLVLVSIYGTYKYRTASLRNRAILLQQSVNQRTSELADEKQRVEALLSKKNDEFANVSHEFRTPLSLVLGPVSQLLASDLQPAIKQKLAIVRRNGFRLLRMVDQLLDIEKFAVQRVTNKKPQALRPLLRLISQSFKDLAEQKQLTFTIDTIDEVYLCFTPDALEKIIVNLLSNAIKYTPAGGKINISAIQQADHKVLFEVSDNGIGIAQHKQSLVFERFHRVLDKQSEQVTGAGIGLALVKELVEAHQGQIKLQSELGKGTTISVILPTIGRPPSLISESASNQEVIDLELESLGGQAEMANDTITDNTHTFDATVDNNKPSLLIVEDNPDMRDYIRQTQQGHYNCSVASNGREGVEKAQAQVPDIIVSDVMMPEMDGYELTRQIKSDTRTSHIPVILLTARGDKQSRLKGWHEKADEYLTKPFDPQELHIRINNLLAIRNILRQRFNQTVFEPPELQEQPQPPAVATPTAEELKLQAQAEFIDALNTVLEGVYQSQKTTIGEIATALAMSERQLFRKLKGTVDMKPTEYLRRFRLKKSCILLSEGVVSSIVAFEVGFNSHSYFTRCFGAQYGCAPSEFKVS